MKILVVCEQGNNRSVTVAHELKYWGHDVLTAGTHVNALDTLDMLSEWADRIIFTENGQEDAVSDRHIKKFQLWDIGPDVYPRPFNKDLLRIAKAFTTQHRVEYKP